MNIYGEEDFFDNDQTNYSGEENFVNYVNNGDEENFINNVDCSDCPPKSNFGDDEVNYADYVNFGDEDSSGFVAQTFGDSGHDLI